MAILKIENISKTFQINSDSLNVLQNISLELFEGEIIAIIGRSGCGKTTLLNVISRLEKPDQGIIQSKGKIGYVLQKDLLLPWRNLLENVILPAEIGNFLNKELIEHATNLLTEFGLGNFTLAFPHEISGGMKQKASLIRMFLHDPDIILFDEPFSAIDFETRLQLQKKTRSSILSKHKSAIFVTHHIEEAITMADRILVLGKKPTQILNEFEVLIPEPLRDPVQIRKQEIFQTLFENIWKLQQHDS
jgi:NitT/TauT family transport system ATP-binding protein